MGTHQPYTKEEHWKAFWRMFYQQKNANRIIEIEITPGMRREAKGFVQAVIHRKMREKHHQLDSKYEWRRWMTGTLGEMVLEKFLDTHFRDRSIGHSSRYSIPDLAPLNLRIGVKSFRVGNFPLINRSRTNPDGTRQPLEGQGFIGISQDLTKAYLFGVAFDEQLFQNEQNPENEKYVKDSNALIRKTAFTDFDQLFFFESIEELRELASQHDSLYIYPSDYAS